MEKNGKKDHRLYKIRLNRDTKVRVMGKDSLDKWLRLYPNAELLDEHYE